MSDDDTIKMRDYLKGTDGRTPCPKCAALIPLSATTCPNCGVHFQGQAEDFSPASNTYRQKKHPIFHGFAFVLLVLIGLVIAAAVIAIIFSF